MLKQPSPTLHKTTRTEITSLFGEAKLVLDETPKATTPFGGLTSFQQCHSAGPFTDGVSAVGGGCGAVRKKLPAQVQRTGTRFFNRRTGALSRYLNLS